jgi:hypothetical protein
MALRNQAVALTRDFSYQNISKSLIGEIFPPQNLTVKQFISFPLLKVPQKIVPTHEITPANLRKFILTSIDALDSLEQSQLPSGIRAIQCPIPLSDGT